MIKIALNKVKTVAFKEETHRATLSMVLQIIQTLKTGTMCCDKKGDFLVTLSPITRRAPF